MFKLYLTKNNRKEEVIPVNEIYNVYELGDYEFYYESNDLINKTTVNAFIEDFIIEKNSYGIQDNKMISKKNKYFQDYFGFATLKINHEIFKLNILIEKFKISEIEEILLFLWESENKIFDNFFSKSTLKARISNVGSDYGLTSKFLAFSDFFYDTFSKLYSKFKNIPHSLLRKKVDIVNFAPDQVTSHSLDWIINNLDNVYFDQNFEGHPDSININNKFGLIERIETDINVSTFAIYENEIILGGFKNIINQLKQLKKDINLNLSLSNYDINKDYADFRDLKKIPYIKLFRESDHIEKKLSLLYNKYKEIFHNTFPRIEKPRVTNIFANSPHYLAAYKTIRESFEYKFNFNGELNLLNIRKLSQLYEAYNLHQIILGFKNKLNIDPFFEFNAISSREDNIIDYVSFRHEKVTIEIFYELKIPNENVTPLLRLDNQAGSYYLPDYIIQFKDDNEIKYSIILDSKYSRYFTLKNNHLPCCISKYVINTGFKNDRYKKIDDLVLIYPGEEKESIQSNPNYAPRILLLPSKPKYEVNLKEYIYDLIEKNLPPSLFKHENEW